MHTKTNLMRTVTVHPGNQHGFRIHDMYMKRRARRDVRGKRCYSDHTLALAVPQFHTLPLAVPQIHEEFKQLVDSLLTEFIEELGVSPETFYEVMNAQGQDKLTSFVLQTILTVDDFTLFKAMMVKRNIDLTNQVLNQVDELNKEAGNVARVSGHTCVGLLTLAWMSSLRRHAT